MSFDLHDCTFSGPALPAPFIRFQLGAQLAQLGLLPTGTVATFERAWSGLRRGLRPGGTRSANRHVIAPLAQRLGYGAPARQAGVTTREGLEDGGWLMAAPCGARLRAWSLAADTDLAAPPSTGRAYRFSPVRSAQRVLLASGERLALLSDGEELRLLLSDPARAASQVVIPLAGGDGWHARTMAPDSYRLVLALAAPKGLAALPALLEAARLSQTRVTRDLRLQARQAIEGFLQGVLDHPANAGQRLPAGTLWEEGLVFAYRLLFVLKLESATDPARAFSFAATRIWREALSPNLALGPLVRRRLDHGHDTGRMLEDGLRALFRLFRDGLSCSELRVPPLGGALFGAQATPNLDRLAWGEHAAARLLDRLLWTSPKGRARERVHYGSLDVEDLGRVYEALLELAPGIATQPMARLRRAKLEVVVPAAQADRAAVSARVAWVENIPIGGFFLRAGLGRKMTGSYYTPHEFVRFLAQEALAPEVARRSPDGDPDPAAILALKVVDPATGSGHFLVEACRYLAEALYAACRACDEAAAVAETAGQPARAATLRQRLANLPDGGLLAAYLPSRVGEGGASGVSHGRALAMCRRLIAVHCLYGVDRNPLAIELAKLSLWLESYAEGLPLTFLDHRLVQGDAIGGPCRESLTALPIAREPLDPALAEAMRQRVAGALCAAERAVSALQATVGTDAADVALKQAAKQRLDEALRPWLLLAQAWAGAVALATQAAEDAWLSLARAVTATAAWPAAATHDQTALLAAADRVLAWDLAFPGVFPRGFDVVLSNPPWEVMQPSTAEFFAGRDLSILDATDRHAAHAIRDRLLADPDTAAAWAGYRGAFDRQRRLVERLYHHQRSASDGALMGGKFDLYRIFAERFLELVNAQGSIAMVVPAAFHANEGASGIRRLYLERTNLALCLSFENRKSLFDIHARYRFALVVARRPGPTEDVRCAFYLSRFEQLAEPARWLRYDRALLDASGGAAAALLELRDAADVAIARRMVHARQVLGDWLARAGITLSRELHMSDDAGRFVAMPPAGPGDGQLVLHEGKTIHQFSDRWETRPRYAVRAADLSGKSTTLINTRHYRAACREIARSTDERTAIAAMLPPGVVCGHTITVERRPATRPNAAALLLVGLMNSFPFDWFLRQRTAVHVSLYILAELPVPTLPAPAQRLVAHGALRMCCNHAGYAALWREQLGAAWREPSPERTWPVITPAAERWRVRAAMDAVIASAYGLGRSQYGRLLEGFSHRSYPPSRALCLAAFDALAGQGLEAFCRDSDPYHDQPLVLAPPSGSSGG